MKVGPIIKYKRMTKHTVTEPTQQNTRLFAIQKVLLFCLLPMINNGCPRVEA